MRAGAYHSMKSVGETMAIGRNFKEAPQKGLRGLEVGRAGFGADGKELTAVDDRTLKSGSAHPVTNGSYVGRGCGGVCPSKTLPA